jgi:hypothetical protein
MEWMDFRPLSCLQYQQGVCPGSTVASCQSRRRTHHGPLLESITLKSSLLFQLYRVDVFQTKKLSKKLVDDLEFGGSFVFYVWIAHLRGDILLLTKNNGDIILKLSSLSALTCMYLNYLCAKCRSSCKSLIYI